VLQPNPKFVSKMQRHGEIYMHKQNIFNTIMAPKCSF
jgi:hypothetical protein